VTERNTVHASFTIERRFAASPDRVFAAWAGKAAKARWFGTGWLLDLLGQSIEAA